ncbi:MAG: matrixin family metalloprotease [Myxococcales bacterium]|nr:matrixin family metalloprotease [Myxococcales bacterium]
MRRTLHLVFIAIIAIVAPAAEAAPHDVHVAAQPELHASAKTLFHYGRDYVVSKSCIDTSGFTPIADPNFNLVVYLNFDGEKLTAGGNDSRTNQTTLITVPELDYPALSWDKFGGRDTAEKKILDELKILFGEYALEFVTTRPASGDYTMVMVGGVGTNVKKGSPGTVGIAPLDCKNNNKNDLAVVFGDKVSSAQKVAFVIAHELGHTLGLVHVNDNRAIMNPGLTSETCCFVEASLTEPGQCSRGSTQDAKKILTENVGTGQGDQIPPLVWFVRPGDDALLPSSFSIEVGAADDLRVARVDLYVDGEKKLELDRPPYVLSLRDMADGEHTLRAVAWDFKPNQVSAEIKVTVDKRCPADGTCYLGAGGVGASCENGADCTSGACASKDGSGVCVQKCQAAGDTCPDGTSCLETAVGTLACVAGEGYNLSTSGGGCTVGASDGGTPLAAALATLLLALVVIGRRRRRRSASR